MVLFVMVSTIKDGSDEAKSLCIPNHKKGKSAVGVIVGGIFAVLILIGLIAGLMLWRRRNIAANVLQVDYNKDTNEVQTNRDRISVNQSRNGTAPPTTNDQTTFDNVNFDIDNFENFENFDNEISDFTNASQQPAVEMKKNVKNVLNPLYKDPFDVDGTEGL